MRTEAPCVPPVRARLRGVVDATTEKLALRAALSAAHLFGLAAGILLRQLRAMDDPLAQALAQAQEERLKAVPLARALHILGARFDKLPERKRPFYTPTQRFQILELKNLLGWPAPYAAKVFRVCTHTILNWERLADPSAETVGNTVMPTPPVTRRADVLRQTVQLMAGCGFGDDETIAMTLTRAGWKISERSVGRIKRERRTSGPLTLGSDEGGHKTARPVIARFVHHVWMMDVSIVQQCLGGPQLFLATVFDAFSRSPLVLQTFERKPGASAMARLLKLAVKAFGKGKYVITDQGKEFTGKVFRKTASRVGIHPRFGTKDRIFATARLERFWRTLKELGHLKLDQPLAVQDLERRVERALSYYLCFRPHRGLQGATPAEVFCAAEPRKTTAVMPPRGKPGDAPVEAPFTVAFLDRDRRAFPILLSATA